MEGKKKEKKGKKKKATAEPWLARECENEKKTLLSHRRHEEGEQRKKSRMV